MAEHYVRVPEAFSSVGGNPAHAWDKWVMKFDIFHNIISKHGVFFFSFFEFFLKIPILSG